jgi:hypothetical protein
MKPLKILSLLVDQFNKKHQHPPEKIIVHPLALVVLSARQSLAPVWNGIPVVCEDFKPVPLKGKAATKLGVIVYNSALRGIDL